MPKKKIVKNKEKRRDWELNQELISNSIIDHLKINKKLPTTRQLSEMTGLATNTIDKHIKDIDFDKIRFKGKHRALWPSILAGQAIAAAKGSSKSAMFLAKVSENFSEKVDITGTVTHKEDLSGYTETELIELRKIHEKAKRRGRVKVTLKDPICVDCGWFCQTFKDVDIGKVIIYCVNSKCKNHNTKYEAPIFELKRRGEKSDKNED